MTDELREVIATKTMFPLIAIPPESEAPSVEPDEKGFSVETPNQEPRKTQASEEVLAVRESSAGGSRPCERRRGERRWRQGGTRRGHLRISHSERNPVDRRRTDREDT